MFVYRCKITTFISFGKIYSHKVLLLVSICRVMWRGCIDSAVYPMLSLYVHYS